MFNIYRRVSVAIYHFITFIKTPYHSEQHTNVQSVYLIITDFSNSSTTIQQLYTTSTYKLFMFTIRRYISIYD